MESLLEDFFCNFDFLFIYSSKNGGKNYIIISFAMEVLSKFVETYSSVFEQCLLSREPVAHARNLPNSIEKNLLLFLLEPHSEQYKEVLRVKYQIKGELLEAINKWKTYSKITKATSPDQIKYLIQKFIKDNPHAYNYSKPADFHSAASQGKSEKNALPSTLKPIKPLSEWATEEINRNEDQITNFTKKALQSLSQNRLLKLKTANKQKLLSLPHLKEFPDKFVVQFIKSFYEEMLKNNKSYDIPTHVYDNLSKTQFMLLKEAIPTLINKSSYLRVWFSHSYDEELQPYQKGQLSMSEKDEKRKILLRILKDLESLKTNKTKSMRRSVLKELLLLDISRDDVDKAVFLEYIKDNPNSSSFENQKMRHRKNEMKSKKSKSKSKSKAAYQQEEEEESMSLFSYSNYNDEDQIVKDSLQRLFKKKDASATLVELQEYFEAALLNKLYAIVKLSEGAQFEEYQNYLSPAELKELKEKKEITILDNNKRKWKADEEVELKVRVKNVTDIHVQVYRIDLEKHFSEDNTEIDQTQNLSYLQPNHSYHYATETENPFLTQIYDIKIEGVPKGRGVWIVELEGEGISSRAFIRKGAIVSTNTNNSVGTEFKFFDESGVQIKDYVIWMEGKKHSVESAFTVPYGETEKNINLTIVKDGYAEIFSVYVQRESYRLDVDYIYNTESFVVGTIAKILLHPKLHMSFDRNMDVSLKLLEKVKILVTLTNNLGIKSTIDFDNVQFKSTEDYLLEFPIQSYTSRIEITVSGKVRKYNKVEEQLTSSKSIDINLNEGNTNFLDLYLRKTKQGHKIFLLGKNGEAVPKTEVVLQILPCNRYSEQTQNLMTSKEGSVTLGDLKGIERITARVNLKSGSVARQWSLNQSENEFQIPAGAIYLEGQQIILPTPFKQNCNLWKVIAESGVYSQNHSDKIQCDESKLTITGLKRGKYFIEYVESDIIVDFTVIQGKLWENEQSIYDEKNGVLYHLDPHQNNHFTLGEATFEKEQGHTVIEIPVRSTYDITKDHSFRAHLMASNFAVPDFNDQLNVKNFRGIRETRLEEFTTKQSQFYNNKVLSQEASYVINRAKEKKYIGNNLQKPKMFLKRIQVRDTTQAEQILGEEGDYSKQRQMMHRDLLQASSCPRYGFGYNQSLLTGTIQNPLQLNTHNNFLSLPGSITCNQKGQLLRFTVPQTYSHFQCLAFSKFSSVIKKFDHEAEEISIKNLSHAGIQSDGKDAAWTMSRQVYKAQKGQNIKVGRDSIWSAVGLSNIAGFAKIKGATLEDWVTNWSIYSEEEKLKVYDDKVCHELNTYIRFNDHEFFKKIVAPFIRNKVNKTFVDFCLLDHQDALEWTSLQQYQQLNQFEKALLVQQLVKANRKQEAQAIANSMDSVNKSNRISFQRFKKQFDTVITAKLVQQTKPIQPPFLPSAYLPGNRTRQTARHSGKSKKTAQPYAMMMSSMGITQNQFEYRGQSMEGDQCQDEDEERVALDRAKFTQPFKQMQKTKQYTETTYSKLKYAHESKNLIKPSPFWTSVAQHFINGQGDFLSENFMYLSTSVEFTLASCFIPNQKLLQYGLANQGENLVIEASSSFLIFVREVKSLPFERKFGVMLNQRFFNPDDRYCYEEDGTRIEKQTNQFIIRRPYCIQTLITNTSGTKLQLQLLIDIPRGSVPLKSHENTQIQSINLEPYSTLSFQRYFYFPSIGTFSLYPANACRGGTVIAKANEINQIEVLQVETVKKMDTLENILKSGEKAEILQYLKTKNIFDQKIFDPSAILWMFKDKNFFLKVLNVLRFRKYYLSKIWIFGYYHKDLETIVEFEQTEDLNNHENVLKNLSIFEYFPYYSSRTHKFLNENKSTIRNEQFKKTYFSFLFASLFNDPTSSRSRVAFIYYLLLQDRIDEAENVLSQIELSARGEHELQFDYIECFIDMSKGYPTFSKARRIAEKYVSYPVKSWQKMFKEIADTLRDYDSEEMVDENKQVEFSASVLNEGKQLKISIPADTSVEVCFYDVNLELYFSAFPFIDMQTFSSNIAPNNVKVYGAGQSREEKLVRDENMKDCFVQVCSSTSGLKKKKVSSFLWSNPDIKIKVKEDSGSAQVFYQNKKQAGCYCKVYQMKNGQSKFYRDGYTDITGTFKYALSDMEGITQFSILFMTDFGGVVQKVKPPSQQAYLS